MALRNGLILLGATALLTGLLVPLVKARMDDRFVARQREAQEDLARDSKFIEAQTDFLNRLSTDLWRIAGKILAVSYYAIEGSPAQFADAYHEYDSSAFDELFELRAHVSRSERLVSEEAHRQLEQLHTWWFGDLDIEVRQMAHGAESREAWRAFHRSTMQDLLARIDEVLRTIARDVGVTERRQLVGRSAFQTHPGSAGQ